MPLDELPLSDEQIALLQRWIDQGARATPTSAPAPAPWEAPLALTGACAARRRLARLESSIRSPRLGVSREGPCAATDARVGRDVRATRLPGHLGPAAARRRSAGVRRRRHARQARPTGRPLLADDRKYAEHWISFWNDLLRNEDGQTYFSEQNGRKSITEWLMASLVANRPYDQFVARLLNPSAAGRSRGLPDRRQLARRDERGGDAVDAGVTEHRAGVPRRELQVQCVSRQLRQQVEAEGRVWRSRRISRPSPSCSCIAATSRATSTREPSFFYPELGRPTPSPSLSDRRATAAAIFTDPRNGRMPRTVVNRIWTAAPRPRHRAELGRDGRQAVESGGARLAGQRFRRARVRRQAPDRHDHDVARLPDAGRGSSGRGAGAQLRLPRPGIAATHGGAVRRCDRHDDRRVERLERPAPDSGEAGDDCESGGTASTAGASARPATGLGLAQRRLLRSRVPQQLFATHPRARPADSRSGHLGARDRGDDAAVAGARERRDADGAG